MRRELTRRQRLVKNYKTYNFACAAISLDIDKNLHLIYRNLCNFGGKEMFVIGSNQWFRGATNGLEELIKVKYFPNISEFLDYVRNETDYSIVAVEQHSRSQNIFKFKYPKNPLFIFGNENCGLNDEILAKCENIIEIPMEGPHPCANVSSTASMVLFDYVRQNYP